jgi:leader peptidase (prepilin peptidase) / N-methyltransferase
LSWSRRAVIRTSVADVVALLRDPAPLSSFILVTAALLVVLFVRSGTRVETLALIPLLVGLASIAVLDVTARLIPDVITLPGLAYAVVLAALLHKPSLSRALLGIAIAGGLALLFSIGRRRGFGGGDIKLMAALGAALGWEGALIAFLVAYVTGALTIVGLLITRRRWPDARFPIGAFIALSGAVIIATRG